MIICKRLSGLLLILGLGVSSLACATNSVTISTDNTFTIFPYPTTTPISISYQVVHENKNKILHLDSEKTISMYKKNIELRFDLNRDAAVGVIINKIAGHSLPIDAKKFGEKTSCTARTDQIKQSAKIYVGVNSHEISCFVP